jgi:hypothetical protein
MSVVVVAVAVVVVVVMEALRVVPLQLVRILGWRTGKAVNILLLGFCLLKKGLVAFWD